MRRIDKEDLPYPWEINYCRWQFEWLLSPDVWNLIQANQWPFAIRDDEISTKTGVHHAPFEMISLIKAEVESRLESTGKDGDMCFSRFHNEWACERIARNFNLSYYDVQRRIKRAMIYMIGKRKRISYSQWIANGWHETRRVKTPIGVLGNPSYEIETNTIRS
jgi:hypothetical protein